MKYFFSFIILATLTMPAVLSAQEVTTTTTVTTTEPATTGFMVHVERAKNWSERELAKLEKYRLEQATYFAQQRAAARKALGISDKARDGTPILPDENVPVSGTIEREGGDPWEHSQPMSYVIMIYATALASLFGTKPLFYIVLVAVTLFILRQLFRWIF